MSDMLNIKGLTTGIGSLADRDIRSALDIVFKYTPNIPFWPQLPKRDAREGMVAQFSENLPCLKMSGNDLIFDPQHREEELEKFYDRIIAGDTDYFKITDKFAKGLHGFLHRLEKEDNKQVQFVKCQVTGPFTFLASINDDKGRALLHDHVFMQVAIKALSMKALWQIKLFSRFGKKIIVSFDEPYLGCFGSAYTPINRDDVIKGLVELTAPLKSEGVLTGVHCCGNTDWSIFTDVPSIDFISFDAFGFLDKFILYADNLKSFIEREGIICWGVIPTQEFSCKETPQALFERIKSGISALTKKGLDKDLLQRGLIVSPACGLGSLDLEKSEAIFEALSEVSALIKKSL